MSLFDKVLFKVKKLPIFYKLITKMTQFSKKRRIKDLLIQSQQ